MGQDSEEQSEPETYYEDVEQAEYAEEYKKKLSRMDRAGKAQEAVNKRLTQTFRKADELAPTVFRLRRDFLTALQSEAPEILTDLLAISASHEKELRYYIDADWDVAKKQNRYKAVQALKAWALGWQLDDSQNDWVLRAALHTIVRSVRQREKVNGFTYSNQVLMADFDSMASDKPDNSSRGNVFEFTYKTVVDIDKDSKKNFIKRVEEEVRIEARRFIKNIETQKFWEHADGEQQVHEVTSKTMIKEPYKPATAALAYYVKNLKDEKLRGAVLHPSTLGYETVGYSEKKLKEFANQIGLYINGLNSRP